jgi:hypothetical protein
MTGQVLQASPLPGTGMISSRPAAVSGCASSLAFEHDEHPVGLRRLGPFGLQVLAKRDEPVRGRHPVRPNLASALNFHFPPWVDPLGSKTPSLMP